MKYKHILVATDLSSYTNTLSEQAKRVADRNNAEISFVYVLEHYPATYGGEYSIPIDADLQASIEKQAHQSLRKLGKKFNVPEDRLHLATGSVKLGVIDTAEAVGADLIVVGTHSHSGLKALLGSRASSILNHAKCDVLVVHLEMKK